GDPCENDGRVLVSGLDALEVQDGQAAESRELAREANVDDRVHGRRQDGDSKLEAAEALLEVDVARFDGFRSGRERDVLEAIGRTDRIDLGSKAASPRAGQRF